MRDAPATALATAAPSGEPTVTEVTAPPGPAYPANPEVALDLAASFISPDYARNRPHAYPQVPDTLSESDVDTLLLPSIR